MLELYNKPSRIINEFCLQLIKQLSLDIDLCMTHNLLILITAFIYCYQYLPIC